MMSENQLRLAILFRNFKNHFCVLPLGFIINEIEIIVSPKQGSQSICEAIPWSSTYSLIIAWSGLKAIIFCSCKRLHKTVIQFGISPM